VTNTLNNTIVRKEGGDVLSRILIRVIKEMDDSGGRTSVHPTPQAEKPHTLFMQSSEGLLLRFKGDADDVKVLLDCHNILIFFKDGSQDFIPGFARELFAAMNVDGFAVFTHDRPTTANLTRGNKFRQQDYCLATIKLGAHGKKDKLEKLRELTRLQKYYLSNKTTKN